VKATVYKMGGSWIWECSDGHGGTVGGRFSEEQWAFPWACAYSRAVEHVECYHSTQAGEIVGEL
jgi:hypothetical protein